MITTKTLAPTIILALIFGIFVQFAHANAPRPDELKELSSQTNLAPKIEANPLRITLAIFKKQIELLQKARELTPVDAWQCKEHNEIMARTVDYMKHLGAESSVEIEIPDEATVICAQDEKNHTYALNLPLLTIWLNAFSEAKETMEEICAEGLSERRGISLITMPMELVKNPRAIRLRNNRLRRKVRELEEAINSNSSLSLQKKDAYEKVFLQAEKDASFLAKQFHILNTRLEKLFLKTLAYNRGKDNAYYNLHELFLAESMTWFSEVVKWVKETLEYYRNANDEECSLLSSMCSPTVRLKIKALTIEIISLKKIKQQMTEPNEEEQGDEGPEIADDDEVKNLLQRIYNNINWLTRKLSIPVPSMSQSPGEIELGNVLIDNEIFEVSKWLSLIKKVNQVPVGLSKKAKAKAQTETETETGVIRLHIALLNHKIQAFRAAREQRDVLLIDDRSEYEALFYKMLYNARYLVARLGAWEFWRQQNEFPAINHADGEGEWDDILLDEYLGTFSELAIMIVERLGGPELDALEPRSSKKESLPSAPSADNLEGLYPAPMG